jgi:hypothetical protein
MEGKYIFVCVNDVTKTAQGNKNIADFSFVGNCTLPVLTFCTPHTQTPPEHKESAYRSSEIEEVVSGGIHSLKNTEIER